MKHRSSLKMLCAPPPVGVPARGWGGGRTLLVAVRRDAAGRELLAWALAKAAAAGDRVVALHVTTADGSGTDETSRAAADSLASVLAAYDGFCSLKKIDLELRVCHGSSMKKSLVNEAISYGASQLILGVTKNSRPLGLSATVVAKYCAKRVPQSCTVIAVSNGAIVYHGNAIQEEISHCCTMSPRRTYSAMAETPRRIYRKILDASATGGEKAQDDWVVGHCRSLQRNVSMPMSARVSRKVASVAPQTPSRFHRRELPEVAAGWPLLRKDIMPSSPECSEVSVVEWAMRLPSRCSTLTPVSSDKMSDHRVTSSAEPSPMSEEAAEQVREELASIRDKYSSMYTMFSYSDLARITSNFSPDHLVGKGGASRVYSSRWEDGKELAVKVLKSSEEVVKEFVAEINIVSSVDHKNAMALVGFCVEHGKLMLVYEYMRRGSLEEILHGEKQGKCSRLSWPERFKVAVGIARALDHLHGGGGSGKERPVVIHRDVKSSNILVSDDCEPKLCDFGLALWGADAGAQITGDDVAGTFGYLAPEYFMHGKVSDKIDVYAFGVVLLELVSGRKPVSSGGPKGQESLVMWANSVVQGGKLTELVDPSLPTEDGDAGEVERMTLAAALCITRTPQHRPSIAKILKLLEGDSEAVHWARSQLGVSDISDDYSEEYAVDSTEKNDIQSYINLALLDVDVDDDDCASVCSTDFMAANMSLEEYMKGRWSRSSSLTEDGGSVHGGNSRIFV